MVHEQKGCICLMMDGGCEGWWAAAADTNCNIVSLLCTICVLGGVQIAAWGDGLMAAAGLQWGTLCFPMLFLCPGQPPHNSTMVG